MNSVEDLSLSAGIDLPWLRSNRGIARRSRSHASPDYRHALHAHFSQIVDGRQYIQVERRIHRVGVAGTSRLAVAAEVERQHAKSRRRERSSLLLPAFLVEGSPVRQHDAAFPFSIDVGVDYASVLGRKETCSCAAANRVNRRVARSALRTNIQELYSQRRGDFLAKSWVAAGGRRHGE